MQQRTDKADVKQEISNKLINLPEELLLSVLNFFTPKELAPLSSVSKKWGALVRNNENYNIARGRNILRKIKLPQIVKKEFERNKVLESIGKGNITIDELKSMMDVGIKLREHNFGFYRNESRPRNPDEIMAHRLRLFFTSECGLKALNEKLVKLTDILMGSFDHSLVKIYSENGLIAFLKNCYTFQDLNELHCFLLKKRITPDFYRFINECLSENGLASFLEQSITFRELVASVKETPPSYIFFGLVPFITQPEVRRAIKEGIITKSQLLSLRTSEARDILTKSGIEILRKRKRDTDLRFLTLEEFKELTEVVIHYPRVHPKVIITAAGYVSTPFGLDALLKQDGKKIIYSGRNLGAALILSFLGESIPETKPESSRNGADDKPGTQVNPAADKLSTKLKDELITKKDHQYFLLSENGYQALKKAEEKSKALKNLVLFRKLKPKPSKELKATEKKSQQKTSMPAKVQTLDEKINMYANILGITFEQALTMSENALKENILTLENALSLHENALGNLLTNEGMVAFDKGLLALKDFRRLTYTPPSPSSFSEFSEYEYRATPAEKSNLRLALIISENGQKLLKNGDVTLVQINEMKITSKYTLELILSEDGVEALQKKLLRLNDFEYLDFPSLEFVITEEGQYIIKNQWLDIKRFEKLNNFPWNMQPQTRQDLVTLFENKLINSIQLEEMAQLGIKFLFKILLCTSGLQALLLGTITVKDILSLNILFKQLKSTLTMDYKGNDNLFMQNFCIDLLQLVKQGKFDLSEILEFSSFTRLMEEVKKRQEPAVAPPAFNLSL